MASVERLLKNLQTQITECRNHQILNTVIERVNPRLGYNPRETQAVEEAYEFREYNHVVPRI